MSNNREYIASTSLPSIQITEESRNYGTRTWMDPTDNFAIPSSSPLHVPSSRLPPRPQPPCLPPLCPPSSCNPRPTSLTSQTVSASNGALICSLTAWSIRSSQWRNHSASSTPTSTWTPWGPRTRRASAPSDPREGDSPREMDEESGVKVGDCAGSRPGVEGRGVGAGEERRPRASARVSVRCVPGRAGYSLSASGVSFACLPRGLGPLELPNDSSVKHRRTHKKPPLGRRPPHAGRRGATTPRRGDRAA